MKRVLLFACVIGCFRFGNLHAEPAVAKTEWRGLEAFRMSDGDTEAVVVPKLGGRMVHFGKSGGRNWLWTGEPGAEKKMPALYWGGEKAYIGPHTLWRLTLPTMWPPPSPDFAAHDAEVLDGARLRVTSPEWPGFPGAKIAREFSFDADGMLVIQTRIAPVAGARTFGALWTVAQIAPSDAIFVPLNPVSPYKDNFYWFEFAKPKDRKGATVISPSLLRIAPVEGEGFKMGASPRQPALAATKGNAALILWADPQGGEYPEGAEGAGLSVEVYHHNDKGTGQYAELEFLSPWRVFDRGVELTTRWKIEALPDGWTPAEIEKHLTQGAGVNPGRKAAQ